MARPAQSPRDKVLEMFRTYPVLSKDKIGFLWDEVCRMVDEGALKRDARQVNGVTVMIYYLPEFEDWVKQYHEMADDAYKK